MFLSHGIDSPTLYNFGGSKLSGYKLKPIELYVTECGQRLLAAWKEEDVDTARHRQKNREATILGKLLSHTHESVEFCEATTIGLADESKESLYGRETDRDLRSD